LLRRTWIAWKHHRNPLLRGKNHQSQRSLFPLKSGPKGQNAPQREKGTYWSDKTSNHPALPNRSTDAERFQIENPIRTPMLRREADLAIN
jgi:hypothetical protein